MGIDGIVRAMMFVDHGRAALAIFPALVLLACRSIAPEVPFVPSHVMVFELSETGAITPYAYSLRERELEPVSEREIRAVLAGERAGAPGRKGHIAVRARNRWGTVIYRTLVEVVLVKRTICCPHQEYRAAYPLSFSVVVPATAVSISFDGWQRASRVELEIGRIQAAVAR
jgi:hypothetical protein